MRMLLRAASVIVVLAAGVAAGPDPVAPKLGTEEPPTAAEGRGEPGVARALPRTAAVCQDRRAKRCWVAAREPECGPPGEIFRVVIDDAEHADVGVALAQCREELAR